MALCRGICKCFSFKVKLDKGQTDYWGNNAAMVRRKWVNWLTNGFFPHGICDIIQFTERIHWQMDYDLSCIHYKETCDYLSLGSVKRVMLEIHTWSLFYWKDNVYSFDICRFKATRHTEYSEQSEWNDTASVCNALNFQSRHFHLKCSSPAAHSVIGRCSLCKIGFLLKLNHQTPL